MLDDIRNDSHAGIRRVDIGVANHELLEDVVLDSAGQFGLRDSLLLSRHDETGQNWQHCPIHGHRHRHFVQGDLVKEDFHILDRVDGNPGLAHIPRHSGVVRVVATMGGEIESHREPLLTRFEVGSVEGVGFLRRGEAGVLTDRPGTIRVHRGPGAPQERKHPRQRIHVVHFLEIFRRVKRLDLNSIGTRPDQFVQIFSA